MMRKICFICLVVLLGAWGKMAFADGKADTRTTISFQPKQTGNPIIIGSNPCIGSSAL